MNAREITKKMKEAGLNKDQISYAKTLMSMGRTLEEAIEEAKEYQGLKFE